MYAAVSAGFRAGAAAGAGKKKVDAANPTRPAHRRLPDPRRLTSTDFCVRRDWCAELPHRPPAQMPHPPFGTHALNADTAHPRASVCRDWCAELSRQVPEQVLHRLPDGLQLAALIHDLPLAEVDGGSGPDDMYLRVLQVRLHVGPHLS